MSHGIGEIWAKKTILVRMILILVLGAVLSVYAAPAQADSGNTSIAVIDPNDNPVIFVISDPDGIESTQVNSGRPCGMGGGASGVTRK